MTLGKRIKHYRHQNGFSLLEMEKRTGIKKEYLCRIETDSLPNPTYKTMRVISQGLGINLIDLFDLTQSQPPKISVVSAAKLSAKPEPGSLIAIPIIDQQSAGEQSPNLTAEGYVLIGQSLIADITKVGSYRALYLDKNDTSMSPVIPAGSLLCIDFGSRNITQLLGKMVLLKDADNKCRAAYLKTDGDFIIGMPHNINDYTPFLIPRNKNDAILGKLVGCFNCIPPQ